MRILPFGLLALVCCVSGCGDGGSSSIPAKGAVKTKSGVACAGALVVFHPAEPARANDPKPVATVAEDGSYVLTTKAKDDGAPEGDYNVTIVWNGKARESKLSLSGEGNVGRDQLGGRYGDPRSPKLKASVKKGSPNEFHFEVQ